jgi:hypothetical protein
MSAADMKHTDRDRGSENLSRTYNLLEPQPRRPTCQDKIEMKLRQKGQVPGTIERLKSLASEDQSLRFETKVRRRATF